MKDRMKALLKNLLRELRLRRSVPYRCVMCELLAICRDEQNGWKCRQGCLLLNKEKKWHEKKDFTI